MNEMYVCMYWSYEFTGIYTLKHTYHCRKESLPVTKEESRRAGFQRRRHDLSDCPYFFFFMFSSNNLQADGSSVVDIRVI